MNTTIIGLLHKVPIFSNMSNDELQDLANITIEKVYRKGEFVFWEDDPSDWFYLIVEGMVKVYKHTSSGKEFVISYFGPGEIFGEAAVFENKPYPASAQAMRKTSLLCLGRDNFKTFIKKQPEVALKIINILSERLRMAQGRLRDIASGKVEQRLARMLLMLSIKMGDTLPFTRQEIAEMAGTTTETTIRVLSSLGKRNIIRSIRGKVIITDRERLKLLGEGPPAI